MLRSFAFIQKDVSPDFYYDVWQEIQKWRYYFYKFAGVNAEEAMHLTLIHTLTHFDRSGNLPAYIKKLAREIAKDNSKIIPVDFMEQTLADSKDYSDEQPSVKVDTGRVPSFENEVVNRLSESRNKADIQMLALEFLDKFVLLCNSLRNHDTTTRYYPDIFMKNCLDLSSKYENFNDLCLQLYDEYQDDIEWFLDLDNNTNGWKEADFSLIHNSISKRVILISEDTEEEVEDADNELCFIKGTIKDKRVYKIPYEDLWEYMCDLIDSYETNEMKFILGNSYIVRTLGGSYSTLNIDLYNFYDLIRSEILTNVLYETSGRLLNIGSKCIYILAPKGVIIPKKIVKGIPIEFKVEDITDYLR